MDAANTLAFQAVSRALGVPGVPAHAARGAQHGRGPARGRPRLGTCASGHPRPAFGGQGEPRPARPSLPFAPGKRAPSLLLRRLVPLTEPVVDSWGRDHLPLPPGLGTPSVSEAALHMASSVVGEFVAVRPPGSDTLAPRKPPGPGPEGPPHRELLGSETDTAGCRQPASSCRRGTGSFSQILGWAPPENGPHTPKGSLSWTTWASPGSPGGETEAPGGEEACPRPQDAPGAEPPVSGPVLLLLPQGTPRPRPRVGDTLAPETAAPGRGGAFSRPLRVLTAGAPLAQAC